MLKPFPIPTDRDGLVAEIRKRCSEDVRDELAEVSVDLARLLAAAEVMLS
jgi:hypothetical protein